MEQAARGEESVQPGRESDPSGSRPAPDNAQEEEEYSNSTEIKRGIGRANPKQTRKPNPFDYKTKPASTMDRKLDSILNNLQTVSTKDDLRAVNLSLIHI